MRTTVTMSDVAAVAGVTRTTVSRVLSGSGRVSEATRNRVFDAAERLNYLPNEIALSLASGRSKTIGVLAENSDDDFSTQVLIGAERVLARSDFAVLLVDAAESIEDRAAQLRKLMSRRVDGVIALGRSAPHELRSITDLVEVPVVYAFGASDRSSDDSYMADDREAGRIAATHLLELGRRRVAHVTAADAAAVERSAGLLEVLEQHSLDLAYGTPLVGDWTRDWGIAAGRTIAEQPGHTDAVFCGNDQIAFGVISALADAGLQIPGDIAIIGHDHYARGWLSHAELPYLTTINPNLAGVGARAAWSLLERVLGSAPPALTDALGPRLVVGHSTAGTDEPHPHRHALP